MMRLNSKIGIQFIVFMGDESCDDSIRVFLAYSPFTNLPRDGRKKLEFSKCTYGRLLVSYQKFSRLIT